MVSNNAINNTIADNDFSVNRATAGTTVTSSVNHSDNTNAASHVQVNLVSGGASGGDPFIHFDVTGAGEFSWGIDNTDSDLMKLTSGATPSAGTDIITATSAGVVDVPARFTAGGGSYEAIATTLIQGVVSSAGNTAKLLIANTEATNAASNTACHIETNNANGGDPYLLWDIANTAGSASMGLDNTDGDALKITDGAGPSAGNTLWKMTQAGELTLPLTPAVLAYVGTTVTDVTGNNTEYQIIYNTVVTDQNSDYNNGTGVFTSPVTGNYLICAGCGMGEVTNATLFYLKIVSSNRTYFVNINNATIIKDVNGQVQGNGAIMIDMDAADTVHISVVMNGIGGDTADIIGGGTPVSWLSIKLDC